MGTFAGALSQRLARQPEIDAEAEQLREVARPDVGQEAQLAESTTEPFVGAILFLQSEGVEALAIIGYTAVASSGEPGAATSLKELRRTSDTIARAMKYLADIGLESKMDL